MIAKMGHLESYKLTLTALSPVFIGCDRLINKREYIYMPKGQTAFIPDIRKMFDCLEKHNLTSAYEKYMQSPDDFQDNDTLLDFLKKNGIYDKLNSFTSYSVDAGDAAHVNETIKGIDLFIKDVHNQPYIPGSSLKGAFRTALTAKMLKDSSISEKKQTLIDKMFMVTKDEIGEREVRNQGFLKKETADAESDMFGQLDINRNNKSDAVNSIMRAISISDSLPVSTKDLVLCRKFDYAPNNSKNPINLFRECLRPQTKLQFALTVDTYMMKNWGRSIDYIMEALDDFSETYDMCFANHFTGSWKCDKISEKGKPLYLGGGVGFVSKTDVYPLLGKDDGLEFTSKLLSKQFPDKWEKQFNNKTGRYESKKISHHHEDDVKLGVSPHMLKCTKYDNRVYIMGKCEVVIE